MSFVESFITCVLIQESPLSEIPLCVVHTCRLFTWIRVYPVHRVTTHNSRHLSPCMYIRMYTLYLQGVTPSDPEERLPMDIFKAIFAESESDDSSTDSEEEEESKQEELQSQEMQYSKEQTNTIGSHGEELPARDNPTHTMPNTQQPIDRTSVGKISPQDSCTASKDRHEAVEGNGSYADNGDHAVAMEVSTRKEGQPVALPVTYGPALPPSYNEGMLCVHVCVGVDMCLSVALFLSCLTIHPSVRRLSVRLSVCVYNSLPCA